MADTDPTGENVRKLMEDGEAKGARTVSVDPEDGRGKKLTIVPEPEPEPEPEPLKPLAASLDKEAVNKILKSDENLGIIVMDVKTTVFGTLSGSDNTKKVLLKVESNIPTKHGRGGQSALAFARLRMKSHEDYIQRTAELANEVFIDPETKQPIVAGLVLAGCSSKMFDPRLQAKIVNAVVDSGSGGGEKGFNELIAEILSLMG